MMGLPVGYTQMCMTKDQRKSIEYNDKRLIASLGMGGRFL